MPEPSPESTGSDRPFSDRQAEYAAWRDRLRSRDDVIDLAVEDDAPGGEDWSAEALFRSSAIDHDADH
jgi:hypothetical protein